MEWSVKSWSLKPFAMNFQEDPAGIKAGSGNGEGPFTLIC